jgi:Repeat of unknown function (DUF5650)
MKTGFGCLIFLLWQLTDIHLVSAAQFDLPPPTYSGAFGASVAVLPNGNFVIADPAYAAANGTMPNVGAVYLYDGVTLAVINTLTGVAVGDNIGKGGITVLSDGNFLVISPNWNSSRGAVTWGSATIGVSGPVSATNSLIGSTVNDQVGSGGVTVLSNANFVVNSPFWNNAAITNAGAVTFCSGATGRTGTVSAANSLVGTNANSRVGLVGVIVLNNGNYVVNSAIWNNGAVTNVGAVTFCSGTTGLTGAVSSVNSLVGSNANDRIGSNGVTVLNNGNYVVDSANWNNGAITNVGAVTFCSGTSGLAGAVSSANSLVGSNANDQVGFSGVAALSNGNYVVISTFWNNGAGAATWCSGTTGRTGTVSATDSLVGSFFGFVTALNNGNYVVGSPNWNSGRGAATLCNGTTGTIGTISATNSLVGTPGNIDFVSSGGVTALNNGNYVVASPSWGGPFTTNDDIGAATWCSGTTGRTGLVSFANSLVGVRFSDRVGFGGVTALNNGNYVVNSPQWNTTSGILTFFSVGAVTLCNGITGTTGTVSVANSFVGNSPFDQVGSGGITALNTGNYVVNSPSFASSSGIVTWGNGTTGRTGTFSVTNSLVGGFFSDRVGLGGVTALNNGNYVVVSTNWNSNRGALSLGDGTTGTFGVISITNSALGLAANGGPIAFAFDSINVRVLVGFPGASRVCFFGYTPKLVLQQPPNVTLTNGSTTVIGAPFLDQASLTFTIRNIGLGSLTPATPTIDGPNAGLFTVTANPAASVDFNNSTTFTVHFAPTNSGTKTAALHLSSNDAQQSPFTINLTGSVLTFSQDTDGDGLNDAAEFYLAPFGFDWQASQPTLVSNLFANASQAGLYTTNQMQALNVDTPLLFKDPQTGDFALTIAVQKSTNLVQFSPFPMTPQQTTISNGNLLFQFTIPDSAAFFRLQAH